MFTFCSWSGSRAGIRLLAGNLKERIRLAVQAPAPRRAGCTWPSTLTEFTRAKIVWIFPVSQKETVCNALKSCPVGSTQGMMGSGTVHVEWSVVRPEAEGLSRAKENTLACHRKPSQSSFREICEEPLGVPIRHCANLSWRGGKEVREEQAPFHAEGN